MRLSDSEVEARLEQVALRCRDNGLAATPQRLAVYRALLETEDHPDAEVLCARVREQIPNLSLATVYKSLEALERIGAVRELTPLHEAARFDANLEHHHHLVCTSCKKVVDIYDPQLDVALPPGLAQGFKISNVHVQVEGLCPECARPAAKLT